VFPGDLPADPEALFAANGAPFRGLTEIAVNDADFRFVRFRPPALSDASDGLPALPHIRLDRALQFLIGDRLR
jgi:predicted YcjX-like family ATPase